MSKIQISVTTTPQAKQLATYVTNKLGLSLSTALNMCINQIALQKRLPYSTALTKNPYAKYGKPTSTNELKRRIQNSRAYQKKNRLEYEH
ncbi:MAG: hypothetical protein AJITA_00820 [Acetilactobacillus jinshanensis]